MIPGARLLLVVPTLLLAACGHTPAGPASAGDREEALTRARAAVEKLRGGLGREISAAIKRGGPEAAISICAERAPAIATAAGGAGLRIGRTSHRLRNPRNAPPAWVAPLLAEYRKNPGLASSERTIAPGRIGYLEPIRIVGPCLACHGGELAPPVAARIQARYPEDRATGFAAGDLRGLYWVEVDLPRR